MARGEIYPVVHGKKECIDCRLNLDLNKFRLRKQHGKPYRIAKCRSCEYEYNKIHCDYELRRIGDRKRYSSPAKREIKNRYQRAWRKNHIKKNRAYHRKHIKKHVDEISDSYIIRQMRGINEIPVALIKLKRLQILSKRILKLKQNESQRFARPNVESIK